MAFPTKPTSGASRILSVAQANTTATRTFPNLSSLTKNSGDLLIAIAVCYQTGTGTDAAFSSWGGGFTEFADRATSTTMAIGMAYKFSTGSETGTFTVTQAGTVTGHAQLIVMSIAGAHASTPPEASTKINSTASNATPSTLNPSGWDAEDTLWIQVIGWGENSTSGSATGVSGFSTNYDTGFTATLSADATGGVEAGIAFRHLNAASEQPDTAFSVDTSNARHSVMTIAVRPAPAGATGTIAVTQGADTADVDGTHTPPPITGTISPTQAADTANFDGTATPPAVTGTVASTQADDTADLAGTFELSFTGTIGATQSADTADFEATFTPAPITGTLSPTQSADTADFDGTHTPPSFTGTLEVDQTDDTADFTGTYTPEPITGTITAIQDPDTGDFTQSNDRDGELSTTQADDTGEFTGSATPPSFTATIAATQEGDSADLVGELILVGIMAAIQGSDTASFRSIVPYYSVTAGGSVQITDSGLGIIESASGGGNVMRIENT